MSDRVISFIIILFLMIMLNLKDFINLLNDRTDRYIQRYSGMLSSLTGLIYLVLKYDLRKIEFLIYGIYIAIYTLLYFNIKKIREGRKHKDEGV